MVTVIVIYESQTGFTAAMADGVVQGARSVGANVDLLKIGSPFGVKKLAEADAIILGSPVIYGDITPDLKIFIETIKDHIAVNHLDLQGKKGAAFGSYAFSGGWVIQELSEELETLGIRIVVPPLVVVDGLERQRPIRLDDKIQKNVQEFGRSVALVK
ncbi:MAG: FprA family A-type flavoprotein [Candidatus Bathyarchaeota archaeon]|nr:MAG: FprA family A-type flavoprotein [Candidatus Bathyarchaeota archaeon]